jgi:hypothetical protein
MRFGLLAVPATAVAVVTAMALGLGASGEAAGQLRTPADWKWRLDTPGTVVDAEGKSANETFFVAMPPGWHVTTGPATLLYHPLYETRADANFALEAEIFLFPGESQEEYGVFLGGKGLEPSGTPAYVSFVARRDGKGAILRRGGSALVDWTPSEAIVPHAGKEGTAKNVLRVEVGAAEIVFRANGNEVAKVPRAGISVDGHFGFRFGANMNVHASRLDLTLKLAPVPAKK